MKSNSVREVRVQGGGGGLVGDVGLHALGVFVDRLGPAASLSCGVRWAGERAPVHDRGKVLTQAMLMLAGGGEAWADIEYLRAEEGLFGDVPSATCPRRRRPIARCARWTRRRWRTCGRPRRRRGARSARRPLDATPARRAAAASPAGSGHDHPDGRPHGTGDLTGDRTGDRRRRSGAPGGSSPPNSPSGQPSARGRSRRVRATPAVRPPSVGACLGTGHHGRNRAPTDGTGRPRREPATPVRATLSVDRGCEFDGGGG